MGDPTDTTDYPVYDTKKEAIIELWNAKGCSSATQDALFRLMNTNWNTPTDKATIYTPDTLFA